MEIKERQLELFKIAFKKANFGKLSLPNKIDFDKVNRISYFTYGMRGGYSSRFLFRLNEFQEPFLEFVTSRDFQTWHKIIKPNGDVIEISESKYTLGKVDYNCIKDFEE